MKSNCTFKPEYVGLPKGEFHCPCCHEIQEAGLPHTSGYKSDFDDKTDYDFSEEK